ncbi:MAG: cytochrome c [Pseudomonadota bacterium]
MKGVVTPWPAVVLGVALLGSAVPTRAAEDAGAKAFTRYCVHCHGDGLEAVGTLQLARTRGKNKALLVGRKDLPPLYVQLIVRNGLKAMPAFGPAELPDAELAALAAYVTGSAPNRGPAD